jgi:hypothetical protein
MAICTCRNTPRASRWAAVKGELTLVGLGQGDASHLHLQVYPTISSIKLNFEPYGLLVQLCGGKGVGTYITRTWPASGFRRRTSHYGTVTFPVRASHIRPASPKKARYFN